MLQLKAEVFEMAEEKKVKAKKPKLNKEGFKPGQRVSFEEVQAAKIKAIAKQKADREK
tara:strand:- start:816 stop:989 length:174 start_codon:yes stop_codon:yes gene_type:complete